MNAEDVLKNKKINKTDQAIVYEYLQNGYSKAKAYSKVHHGCSRATAAVNGHKVLKKAEVARFLQEYFEDLWENKENEIGRQLSNLLNIANADVSDIIEIEDGNVKIRDLEEIDSSVIQAIDQSKTITAYGENTRTSVKMHDKTKAIAELTKVLNMINQKITVNVNYDKESAKKIQEIFNESLISDKNKG
jgi:phage terminase small subunit